MKKHISIIILLIIHLSSGSQKSIPTNGPCTDEMCKDAKGKWIKSNDLLHATGSNQSQQPEVFKRLDAIHELLLKIYANPIGVDAVWHRSTGDGQFAPLMKIDYTRDGVPGRNKVNGFPVAQYNYTAGFFPYYCARDPDGMWPGWPGETGTWIRIFANSLDWFAVTPMDDTMTINQLPVKMKVGVKEMWKGCELLNPPDGGNIRYVLISRKGMLPYIPVTRKQYLDYCLNYTTKFYDKMMADIEIYQPDKEQRKSQQAGISKQKNDALKGYRDELEKTTAANLLDSPALVAGMTPGLANSRIFITEAEGGQMLIIENPAYMRKDLPKYVPQFFVLSWSWHHSSPEENIKNIVETNFPIEKLQAMIDK